MKLSSSGAIVWTLVIIIVWLFGVVGWCMNLYAVISFAMINTEFAKMTVFFVLRIVGIFLPPLGAILGYF